jgi:hypothetical protein
MASVFVTEEPRKWPLATLEMEQFASILHLFSLHLEFLQPFHHILG